MKISKFSHSNQPVDLGDDSIISFEFDNGDTIYVSYDDFEDALNIHLSRKSGPTEPIKIMPHVTNVIKVKP